MLTIRIPLQLYVKAARLTIIPNKHVYTNSVQVKMYEQSI